MNNKAVFRTTGGTMSNEQSQHEVHWRTDNIKRPGEPDRQTLEERRLDILDNPPRHRTGNEMRAASYRKWGIPAPGDTPSRKDALDKAVAQVLATLDRIALEVDALTEAQKRKRDEARHNEIERMVAEAANRVMRGEVRSTHSTAIRTHIFGVFAEADND